MQLQCVPRACDPADGAVRPAQMHLIQWLPSIVDAKREGAGNWSIASGLSKECPKAHFQLCVLQKRFLHNVLVTHISVYLLWTSAVTSLCMCVWARVCDWCFNPALKKQEPKTGRFSCKSEHVFGPVREKVKFMWWMKELLLHFFSITDGITQFPHNLWVNYYFIFISICFTVLLVC